MRFGEDLIYRSRCFRIQPQCFHGDRDVTMAARRGAAVKKRDEMLRGHFWHLYLTHRHSMFLFFLMILSTVLLYVVVVGLFQSGSVFHVVIVASLLIRRTHWPLRGLKRCLNCVKVVRQEENPPWNETSPLVWSRSRKIISRYGPTLGVFRVLLRQVFNLWHRCQHL